MKIFWRLWATLFLLLSAVAALGEATTTKGAWVEVEIGLIGAASEDILAAAMDKVQAEGHAGLIVKLDTPGGALENTRNMVKRILASPFPVVVWVGPSGSRAGSAGAFITLAANVAAMAPGTNIGASHPVQGTGQDVGGGKDSEMDRKVTNDTIAFMESICNTRGRNAEMGTSFVATSVSITDQQALENKVIDLIAKDLTDLMEQIDGRMVTVQPGNVQVKLATKGAARVPYEKSLRQKILEILSNPNLFYLLFMAGLAGLGYELTHPGMGFPGVVGAICLILALIAQSVLPVSYGAAALIVAGIAMLVAEAYLPSFGVLGVGGLVAIVLGSIFLVDPSNESGLRVSLYVILPGVITVGLGFFALSYLVVRARNAPLQSGSEALIGALGTALADFTAGTGQIKVDGTIWSAKAPDPLVRGDKVRVVAVKNLELDVRKENS